MTMWLVYLDESGIGNPLYEPSVVVAGVMVRADKSWRMLEQYLKDMADDFALPEDRDGFAFHAVDLVNGGKRAMKEKYPRQKREHFLAALCEIPRRFRLPVLCNAVLREKIRGRKPGRSEEEITREALMHASVTCVQGAEQLMRRNAQDDDVAMVVFEENGDRSKDLRDYYNLFRSDVWRTYIEQRQLKHLVPFDRVIETVYFAAKGDSSILQVADCCAYVLSRHLRGVKQPREWIEPLLEQLSFGPRSLAAERESLMQQRSGA